MLPLIVLTFLLLSSIPSTAFRVPTPHTPRTTTSLSDRVNPYEGEEPQGYVKLVKKIRQKYTWNATEAVDESSPEFAAFNATTDTPKPRTSVATKLRRKTVRFLAKTTLSYDGAYAVPGSKARGNYVSHDKIRYRETSSLGGIPRMERYVAPRGSLSVLIPLANSLHHQVHFVRLAPQHSNRSVQQHFEADRWARVVDYVCWSGRQRAAQAWERKQCLLE